MRTSARSFQSQSTALPHCHGNLPRCRWMPRCLGLQHAASSTLHADPRRGDVALMAPWPSIHSLSSGASSRPPKEIAGLSNLASAKCIRCAMMHCCALVVWDCRDLALFRTLYSTTRTASEPAQHPPWQNSNTVGIPPFPHSSQAPQPAPLKSQLRSRGLSLQSWSPDCLQVACCN